MDENNPPQQENTQQKDVQQDQQLYEEQPISIDTPSSYNKILLGIVAAIVLFVILGIGGYFLFKQNPKIDDATESQAQDVITPETFLETKKLLTLPEGRKGGIINISEDLQHFAYSTEIDGNKYLYADNALVIEGPIQNHFFTSDNKIVYTLSQEDGQYVVADGEKIGGPYVNVRDSGFMPDGRIVFGAQRGEKWYFIVGDKEYGPYVSASDPDPIISPDGRYVSFDVINGTSDNQYSGARYVINGIEENEGSFSVGRGVYSPDSKRFAYFATQADIENDTSGMYVIVNGEKIGPFDDVRGHPEFSPDSSKLAFLAKKDKDWFVVLNGEEGEHYKTMPRLLTFSPDSSKFAYVVVNDKDSSIYINGEIYVTVTNGSVGELAFSHDAQKFAYSVEQKSAGETVLISTDGKNSLYTSTPVTERKAFVVLDGERGRVSERVWGLRFSFDGKHFAYSAKNVDEQFIVSDGVPDKKYKISRQAGSIFITFSPDGEHYTYVARTEDGSLVILDGEALSTVYDSVYRIKFSPDSKHLLYIYGLDDEIWYTTHSAK